MKYLRYDRFVLVLLFPLLVSSLATGQFLSSADLSLERLALSAGTIFSGTVIEIEHAIAADAQPAFVRVKFRVDQAVRGCNAGDTVAIDEWAELWIRGDRYRKGQRVLILLYPPSQTGFSSAVAGNVGSFTIGPDGLLRSTPQQAQILASQATSSQPAVLPAHGDPDARTTRSRPRTLPEQRKLAPNGEGSE